MSLSSDYAAAILNVENETATLFLTYSAVVLLFWDTLCTFDEEIDIIWRTKFSLGAWFYLFTRYGTLLSMLLEFLDTSPQTRYLESSHSLLKWFFISYITSIYHRVCIVSETLASWTSILVTIGFHGLLTLRTYAISGRKAYILVLLLAIDIGRFVNQVISFATIISFCNQPSQRLIDDNTKELIANTVFNLTAESIAFAVTVHATYGNWSFFRRHRSKTEDKNLSVMIFEQGVITFGIIILIPIMTRTLMKIFPERADVIKAAQPFSLSVPTITTCRFFLSLRRRNLHRISLRGSFNIRLSRLQFGRFSILTPLSTSRSWSRSGTLSFPSLNNIQQQIVNEFGDIGPSAMEEPDPALVLLMGPIQEEDTEA